MIEILLMIATYGRVETTRICFEGVKRLQCYNPDKYNIIPFVVSSDKGTTALANEYGFKCVYSKNKPLGKKLNNGIRAAIQWRSFDFLMQLGSDDILLPEALDYFAGNIKDGVDRIDFFEKHLLFGLDRIYFYDLSKDRLKTYHSEIVFGAARCVHCSIILELLRRQGKMWTNKLNKGLDKDSEERIYNVFGYSPPVYRARIPNHYTPLLLDIKDGDNIHSYDSIIGDEIFENEKNGILQQFGLTLNRGHVE